MAPERKYANGEDRKRAKVERNKLRYKCQVLIWDQIKRWKELRAKLVLTDVGVARVLIDTFYEHQKCGNKTSLGGEDIRRNVTVLLGSTCEDKLPTTITSRSPPFSTQKLVHNANSPTGDKPDITKAVFTDEDAGIAVTIADHKEDCSDSPTTIKKELVSDGVDSEATLSGAEDIKDIPVEDGLTDVDLEMEIKEETDETLSASDIGQVPQDSAELDDNTDNLQDEDDIESTGTESDPEGLNPEKPDPRDSDWAPDSLLGSDAAEDDDDFIEDSDFSDEPKKPKPKKTTQRKTKPKAKDKTVIDDSNISDKPNESQAETVTGTEKKKRRRKPPKICPYCGKEFRVIGKYLDHVAFHSDERPHVCDQCGKGFRTKMCLRQHGKVHMPAGSFPCRGCDKTFTTKRYMNLHMKSKHKDELAHICTTCGKGFIRAHELVRHSLTHSGEKPYLCSLCGKGFNQGGNLNVHLKSHTGVVPYTCEICGKGFKHAFSRRNHMAKHAENDEKPNE